MEQDGDMKEEEHGKRGKAVRESVSFILYLIVIVVLTFLMIRYVGQRTRVDGSSMENTLTNGDNLIVDKISYRFHEPERFDIIVFPYQYKEDTYFITEKNWWNLMEERLLKTRDLHQTRLH